MDPNYTNLKKYTLASWYLLPWLRLSPHDFGGLDNFYNCYSSPDGRYLFVSIYSPEFCDIPRGSPQYKGDTTLAKTDEHFMVFEVPEEWEEDFIRYIAGEYSKFSFKAKEHIYEYSGLPIRFNNGERIVSDLRLLALSDNMADRENLSKEWARIFDSVPPNPKGELLWPPSVDDFIELDPPS